MCLCVLLSAVLVIFAAGVKFRGIWHSLNRLTTGMGQKYPWRWFSADIWQCRKSAVWGIGRSAIWAWPCFSNSAVFPHSTRKLLLVIYLRVQQLTSLQVLALGDLVSPLWILIKRKFNKFHENLWGFMVVFWGEGDLACVASHLFLDSSLVLMVFLLFLAHFPALFAPFIPHYFMFEGSAGREK